MTCRRAIIALCLAGAVLSSWTAPADARKKSARKPAAARHRDPDAVAAEKRRAEQALRDREAKERELRSGIQEKEGRVRQVLAELDAIDRRTAAVRAELRSIADEIDSTGAQLTAMGRQQRVTEGEMVRAGDRLRQNLVAIQLADPEDRVADVALLCASGEAERLSTARLTRHELQFRKTRQAEYLDRLRRLRSAQFTKERELQNMRGQRARWRDSVQHSKQLDLARLREIEESKRDFERLVYRLEGEQREARASRVRDESVPREEAVWRDPVSRTGQLLWPVRGPILRPFGRQRHKTYNADVVSTGIEIGAREGTPVRSADAGTVLFADWMQGFGRVMIVGHGSEFMTVYGHLADFSAAKGQRVARGAVIATSGDTGTLGAPSVYFEVRPKGGRAENPRRYLGADPS